MDRNGAARLERLQSLNQVEYANAYNRVHGGGALYRAIGDGIALFTGVGSPLSQVFALGMAGEVSPEMLDDLEDFYRSRGATAEIEVCEHADAGLVRLLLLRGYQCTEHSHVLVKNLGDDGDHPVYSNPIAIIQEPELGLYAGVVASAFAEGEVPPDGLAEIFRIFFYQSNAVCFGALCEGMPAGGGTLFIQEDVAELGGAGTLPRYRGRGIQTDLLRARCAYARSVGCAEAMVTAAPGTISQRNARNLGFRDAYARAKYSLAFT